MQTASWLLRQWLRLVQKLGFFLRAASSRESALSLLAPAARAEQERSRRTTSTPAASPVIDENTGMPQVKGMLVGAPLPSSSSKHEAEKTIIECKHPEYAMKARGNRTRAWWTCNMCHGRWERFNKEDAPVLPPESSVSDLKKAHYSRHAPLVPSSDTILTFGKHRGSTIRFVGTTYPKYCQWLLRTAKEQTAVAG